jgi:hypothetical protein
VCCNRLGAEETEQTTNKIRSCKDDKTSTRIIKSGERDVRYGVRKEVVVTERVCVCCGDG